jgi:outer membrane immunogenic protein
MKRLFISGFAAIATFTGGAAIAADLPAKAPAPVVMRPACAQFGGFYLGGHGGFGSYKSNFNDQNSFAGTIDDGLAQLSAQRTDESFIAGVQGGYNWQTNCTVVGVEADWSWSNIKANANFSDGDAAPATDFASVQSELKWFGTVRVRGGVVVDNLYLYLTGGGAYGKFERTFTVIETGPPTTFSLNSDKVRWGWPLGAGAEWQWARNWSLKGEFLYIRFTEQDTDVPGVTLNGVNFGNPGNLYTLNHQDELWVARLGVNYRF